MNIGIFTNLLTARKARKTALDFRKEQNAIHRNETIAKHKSLITEIEDTCKIGNTTYEVTVPHSDWNIVASCLRAKGYKVSETPFYLHSSKSKKRYIETQKEEMKKNGWKKEMFIKW